MKELSEDHPRHRFHVYPYLLLWWTSLFSEYNHVVSDATMVTGAAFLVQVALPAQNCLTPLHPVKAYLAGSLSLSPTAAVCRASPSTPLRWAAHGDQPTATGQPQYVLARTSQAPSASRFSRGVSVF